MAIPMQGNVAALFNRIGSLGGCLIPLQTYLAALSPDLINTSNGIVAGYNAESDIQAIVGNSYLSILTSSGSSLGSLLQQMASATVNRMVYRDTPQPGQTLTSGNTTTSIQQIIYQMKQQGATVLRMTVSVTPGAFVGTGNGVVVGSVIRPLDGLPLENSFAETVQALCTRDSYGGGATAGNESFTLGGQGAENNVFAYDWPAGSGASIRTAAVNGDASVSQGNYLTNGGFNSWAANVPNNWNITVGSAGTQIFQETSLVYSSTSNLRLTGDGSTLVALTQQFGNTSNTTPNVNLPLGGLGTGQTLQRQTQYSVCLFMRRDGTVPGAGTLVVELVDGNGSSITDAAGTANSFTIALTGLTTNYAAYTGVFRTPVILPARQYLRLRMGTALTNGRSVYVARVGFSPMSQLYTSGPYFNVHSGSVPFVQGDYSNTTVSNSRGAGGTLATFQTLWNQLLGMQQLDLLLPSSATPSIPDSLIA